MATLRELAEQVVRAVEGGVATDESRWDPDFTYTQIHKARAVIARNDYVQNRRWNPSLFQFYYPEYEPFFQTNACISRFRIPTGFIQADSIRDGMMYVGSSNDVSTANPYKARNFGVIKNRTELNDFLQHPILSPVTGGYIGVLREGFVLEVISSTKIKTLGVGGVWDDPTKLPDYNVDLDPYPVSEDLLQLMIVYLKESELNQEASRPPDTQSDSSGTVVVPQSMSSQINKRLVRNR